MKYEIPESLSGLSLDDLLDARNTVKAEIVELRSLDDLSGENLDRLEALLDHVKALDTRSAEIQTEQAALEQRREAARQSAAALDEDEGGDDGDTEPADTEPAEVVEVEETADAEPVLAAGKARPTAAKASRQSPTVVIKKDEPKEPVTVITAAANVPDFNAGDKLDNLEQVAQAFLGRVGSFGARNDKNMKPGVYQMSAAAQKFGVAKIKRKDREFSVDREMGLAQQMEIIQKAGDERSLPGGSLTAAGGWCAPSETLYDLFSYHTDAGTLDIAEVTARRGGIQFTKGPDFMTIFADPDAGWAFTEAEIESGEETKPCYALECPPFTEVRLDAVGFCATAPLLTEAAYPELVAMVLDMLGAGHRRRKSARTIAAIAANAGTAINWGEIGGTAASGVADVLAGLELQAMRIRQTLAMDPEATIEGFAPYWLRAAFRNELSRRLGLDNPFNVTNADVDRWLTTRNIRLQFVYDYQMLGTGNTATWTGFPGSVEIVLYPAGAYTRLVNDVANLQAVYDHDLLTQNEYTAAFMEEGMAVANTRGFGVKIAIDLRYNGSAGFPAIGAGEGITFAEAA